MSRPMENTGKITGEITGRKVLIWFLMFFGVIFAVNGTFFYFAMESWPGLVTEHPYENGLAYNQTLDGAEKQSLLGWKSEIGVVASADGHTVNVTLWDKNEQPLSGLMVETVLRRPVNDAQDLIAQLSQLGAGQYSTTVTLPVQGRWYVDMSVIQDGKAVYRSEQEVMVQP
ncbi:MAG: FixH family protein [Rhodospirillales bacterium]|jgi:nitrogen fixation protein FixH|nr:FixH family protein [Rhodospirillales bacterium]MBT4038758.1 FixH family protein [Rhodospirillales bacterium]MBT6110856.1 FixH family protein [Rhodospirillales bacterium]MBT7778432.1 FixH family protein [Rhodospirillales bacterium]